MMVPIMETIVSHKMCGNDDQWLGAGWSTWEAASKARWAGQVFSLNLSSPPDRSPYVCQLSLSCWVPDPGARGGADIYVNRVKIGRIEDAYERAASNTDFVQPFWTFGGALEVTMVFDKALAPSDPNDRRSLSVVVLGFSLACAR